MIDGSNVHSKLRELAKRNHYQTVYSFARECPVWVFRNREDFTSIQLNFLMYLSFYHSIQTDIYMGDIDERVLENEIYEDAYCYYRNQERKKQASSPRHTSPVNTKSTQEQDKSSFQYLFKSPKKK